MPKKTASSKSQSQVLPLDLESEDEDGDEDKEYNTQDMHSQVSALSASDIKRLANITVHYILTVNQKYAPIKRIDIIKNILKRENARLFKQVIGEAKKILNDVFGFELLHLEKKKTMYILINNMVSKEESHLELSVQENQKRGLLFVILAVIFMNNNTITEGVLNNFLKRLGIDYDSRVHHEVFGDVRKLITQEFVRQQYLDMEKVAGSDPLVYQFQAGERALVEISKRDVLDFVCHIYDEMKPEEWPSQYKEMLREEELVADQSRVEAWGVAVAV